MNKNNRVVITGIGALSPIGNDAKTTWDNALKGVNGIDKITRIDTDDYNVHLAGELKDFNIEDHIDRKEARRMDRFTQYAVVAAREAVKDAQLNINEKMPTVLVYGLVLVSVVWKLRSCTYNTCRKRTTSSKSIFRSNVNS